MLKQIFAGLVVFLSAGFAITTVRLCAEPTAEKVDFLEGCGRVAILIDGMPVAIYCYQDEHILRPYFAHVRTADGIQVTRNHPPIPGSDLPDHDEFHPGIWLAFGDINGFDFWRNKAQVQHVNFVERPKEIRGKGTFAVRNRYFNPDDPAKTICEETTLYSIVPRRAGYMILWDTRFSSDHEFTFGDQEEMGLGIRMATPLRVGAAGIVKLVSGNGAITNSAGAKNEKSVWGETADWCDYSGNVVNRFAGATIFCHPENIRKSRFHARDYGMFTANAFAQKAFGHGEALETHVRPGEELRLRYGIFIHSSPESAPPDLAAAYQDYVRLTEN